MNIFSKKKLLIAFLAYFFINSSAYSGANQVGDTADFTFTGILQGMSFCEVNNGKPIDVRFINVAISKITSGIFIEHIDYHPFTCTGHYNDTYIKIVATPVASSDSTISTNLPGLWLTFLKDGQPLKLNEEIKANHMSSPYLAVQLVKDPAVDLQEGDFSTTVTLVVYIV